MPTQTGGSDDLHAGAVLVLPVLPGGLPSNHYYQSSVVILQRTHLLFCTDGGLARIPVTCSNAGKFLSLPQPGAPAAGLAAHVQGPHSAQVHPVIRMSSLSELLQVVFRYSMPFRRLVM